MVFDTRATLALEQGVHPRGRARTTRPFDGRCDAWHLQPRRAGRRSMTRPPALWPDWSFADRFGARWVRPPGQSSGLRLTAANWVVEHRATTRPETRLWQTCSCARTVETTLPYPPFHPQLPDPAPARSSSAQDFKHRLPRGELIRRVQGGSLAGSACETLSWRSRTPTVASSSWESETTARLSGSPVQTRSKWRVRDALGGVHNPGRYEVHQVTVGAERVVVLAVARRRERVFAASEWICQGAARISKREPFRARPLAIPEGTFIRSLRRHAHRHPAQGRRQ